MRKHNQVVNSLVVVLVITTLKIEVTSTETGAEVVSNIDYERREQDKKRTIKMLGPQYLNAFVTNFKR